ncbi:MAG: hypothetical protein J7L41_02375, partial [Synergistetes bacterium]|nr:hypothetical protein [Synergistota bacterium]
PNAHFVDRYPGTLNVLWGLEYVIINEDVRDRKPKVSVPNTVERIAVTTGGSDPEGVLFWLIDAMRYICKDTSVSFLIGKAFKHRDRLSMVKLPKNFSLRPYSLDAIVDSDVVISAFGITVYELIYLRIPALIVSHTKENAISANVLKERCGCIETLGFFREVSIGIAAERIRGFIKNSSKLSELFHREASLKMCDVNKIVKGVLGGGGVE